MSQTSQASASREEYGTVTKTIPLFGGEIREGEVVKTIARYTASAGNEYLTIQGGLFCNGVTAARVIVKPAGMPFLIAH